MLTFGIIDSNFCEICNLSIKARQCYDNANNTSILMEDYFLTCEEYHESGYSDDEIAEIMNKKIAKAETADKELMAQFDGYVEKISTICNCDISTAEKLAMCGIASEVTCSSQEIWTLINSGVD